MPKIRDIVDRWSDPDQRFTSFRLDVIDEGSTDNSLLWHLLVNGDTRLAVDKHGMLQVASLQIGNFVLDGDLAEGLLRQAIYHAEDASYYYYGGNLFVHRYDKVTLTKQVADVSSQADAATAWSNRESLVYE